MTRREQVTAAALALLAAGLGSVNLDKPFLHHNESSCTQVGKLARNFVKFGYAGTGFWQLDVSGPRLEAYEDPGRYHYVTHPPLTYWLASITIRWIDGEAGVRILPLVFLVGSVLVFWRIARRRLDEAGAALAAALFATFPMTAYNSIATVHLIVVLFFMLCGVLAYLRWRSVGRGRDFFLVAAFQVLACWADWEGYYLAPFILAHLILTDRSRWRYGAALVGLNLIVFGAHVTHVAAADARGFGAVGFLLGAGGDRTAVGLAGLPGYVLREAREIGLYFTIPAALLAGWELVRHRDPFLGCLLLLGADEILFMKYARNHDYFTFCLAPFFALGAAARVRALAVSAQAAAPRAALAGLAAVYVLQAGWVLHDRWTRQGAYEFYYRLARAVDATTVPEDKLVLLTDDIRFYTPYYADRLALWANPATSRMMFENSGPQWTSDRDGIRRHLQENREGFRYVVTADREGVRRSVRFLAQADDARLRTFGVHDDDRPFLHSLCGSPKVCDGFLFWTLPSRP